MLVKTFIGGSLKSNGYVLYKRAGGECYIIDPGYEAKVFVDFVLKNKLQTKGIVLTHLHHDHVGAASKVKSSLNCPILMHNDDAISYKEQVDIWLSDKDSLYLEDEEMIILHTPGHTKGSIAIMLPKSKMCFTGDTIFDTDLGRTDLAGGSEAEMVDSIVNVVDKWENDIWIYPGHDAGCSMKTVRKINQEFLAIINSKERI